MQVEIQVWEPERRRFEQTELHEDVLAAAMASQPYDWPGKLWSLVKGAHAVHRTVHRMLVIDQQLFEDGCCLRGFQEGEPWLMVRWMIKY